MAEFRKRTDKLAKLPLFRGVSQTDLDWLLNHSDFISLDEGQVLLSPEKDNAAVYIVLSGRLEVQFAMGNKGIKAFLDTGNWVGEMSVIDSTRPSATVITNTKVRLLVIPANVIWGLIERSHVAARNMLHALSSRIRQDNKLIAEGLQQQQAFSEKAQTDFLTNLRNRHWLDEKMPEILSVHNINKIPCSIMMIDIDHFKSFNDQYGHLAGDRVLQAVAEVVRNNLREGDAAVRFGGEELMVIMSDTRQENAVKIAQRLCNLIRELNVQCDDGGTLPAVTVSIGVYAIGETDTPKKVLKNVDQALYKAKNDGRDQVVAWDNVKVS